MDAWTWEERRSSQKEESKQLWKTGGHAQEGHSKFFLASSGEQRSNFWSRKSDQIITCLECQPKESGLYPHRHGVRLKVSEQTGVRAPVREHLPRDKMWDGLEAGREKGIKDKP